MPEPVVDEQTPASPLRELIRIAVPSVAAMMSYMVMQFVDKLMCSRIDADPIWVGAQGNGGLTAWIPISMIYGSLFVVNTLVAQNLGAGKPERAPAYAWNAMWVCVVGWLLLIPYGFLLPTIYSAMRDSSLPAEELAKLVRRDELAAQYGQILLFGSVITMATRAIGQFFYGLHRPTVVLTASVVGNLVNFGLNYALVFGHFGFPQLKLVGSGLATVIGTLVEFSIPFYVFFFPMNALYRTRVQWRPSWHHIREIFRIGWPGGLMFGNEMICWGFFMVYLVGHFGPDHSTAGWIAHQWMTLSFMPAVGISTAVTAVVGKQMGAGNPEEAGRRAKLGVLLAISYMCSMGVLFVIFRAPMVKLFIEHDTPPEKVAFLVATGGGFLIATAAFQLFDAIAMTLSGALRGAGDTIWIGVVTVILSWTIIVGGGLALVKFAPGLQSLGPWIAAATYICALSLTTLARFLGGKWKTIKLVERAPVATH